MDEKKNPILKRTDLMLTIDHTGQATPKREELIEQIAKKFKTTPEKIEIIYIFSETGMAKSKVKARVWEEKAPEKKVKKGEEVKPEEEVEVEEKKIEERPKEKKPKEEVKKLEEVKNKKPEEKKEEQKGEETE